VFSKLSCPSLFNVSINDDDDDDDEEEERKKERKKVLQTLKRADFRCQGPKPSNKPNSSVVLVGLCGAAKVFHNLQLHFQQCSIIDPWRYHSI